LVGKIIKFEQTPAFRRIVQCAMYRFAKVLRSNLQSCWKGQACNFCSSYSYSM